MSGRRWRRAWSKIMSGLAFALHLKNCTYHNSRAGGIFRSFAIVGSPTVTKPARRLLIPVIHVTEVMTTAVVPFERSLRPAETSSVRLRRSPSFDSDWRVAIE